MAVYLSGCLSEGEEGENIGVIVTLPPQREMAEALGGDRVDITVMVPPDKSPHAYAPLPAQMTAVAEAEVYMKMGSGVEFENNYMDEIMDQNKDLLVVDCSQDIQLIDMGEHLQQSSPANAHKDTHIWLSPENAAVIVENMFQGLVEVDPEGRELYEQNRDDYLERLQGLDSYIEEQLQGMEGESFLVYHPAWGYFADAYGLRQMAIEEEGKKPGPAGVAAIIEQAKEMNIGAVFVSPQFDRSDAETIADEIDGEVIVVDPMAPDYIENLKHVSRMLAQGLSE